MESKRGLQLAINGVVVIILGLVVLTFLILFFTMGSEGFFGKIKGYFSYSNVDDVVSACNFFVDGGQINAYCCEGRNVKYIEDGEELEGLFNCEELKEKGFNIKELNCEGVC